MTNQAHFKYEETVYNGSHIRTKPDPASIDVSEVTFLTPAKIKAKVDGVEKMYLASVDIINRKVYLNDGSDYLSEAVFSHLDELTILPEDFFQAPDEIRAQAAEANEERERMYNESVGANNE